MVADGAEPSTRVVKTGGRKKNLNGYGAACCGFAIPESPAKVLVMVCKILGQHLKLIGSRFNSTRTPLSLRQRNSARIPSGRSAWKKKTFSSNNVEHLSSTASR
ncbi:hypothetical protein DQ04_13021000 [Trypanosoma grayi]|uniref:hypothetical protein n=1 Tax=Trypanosoma grayi TaxID=71804 RepID=UPI0004F40039|nr:hypothetical protein DQ04_13021000 [Trypanosoma grayi]KEG06622.1 hypothetical protein DQ04_13021000 [Trypanosoma grayi]